MRLVQHIDEASQTTTFKMKTLDDARPVADIELSSDDVPYLPAIAEPNDPGLLFNFDRTDDAETHQTTIVVNIAPGQPLEARQIARITMASNDVGLLQDVLNSAKTIINGNAALQRIALGEQLKIDSQEDLAKKLIERAIGKQQDD